MSRRYDNFAAVGYLSKLQERIKRCLWKRISHHSFQDETVKTYGEICDLAVDRLLLRHLPLTSTVLGTEVRPSLT